MNQVDLSKPRDPADDDAWREIAALWQVRADTTMLNHGSFGFCPQPVVEAHRHWLNRLQCQPMDFFVRQYEPAWQAARQRLAEFVGTAAENLIFVENATQAMNIVAVSLPLQGATVVLNHHEYGAVRRTWERATQQAGVELIDVNLPLPLNNPQDVVDSLLQVKGERRIFVVSHITSPTAQRLPIELLQSQLGKDDVLVVDGPHAVAQLPLNLDALGSDFYCVSCHKWLCGASGSGFLYVQPQWHEVMQPLQMSWGRIRHDIRNSDNWEEEFMWTGTRDPSPWLSLPAAIDFLEAIGWDAFRSRCFHLADYARDKLAVFAEEPEQEFQPVSSDSAYHTLMAHMPLPPGDAPALQNALWQQFGIEVPIIHWQDRRWIRVSCHLYNSKSQIDYLCEALRKLL